MSSTVKHPYYSLSVTQLQAMHEEAIQAGQCMQSLIDKSDGVGRNIFQSQLAKNQLEEMTIRNVLLLKTREAASASSSSSSAPSSN